MTREKIFSSLIAATLCFSSTVALAAGAAMPGPAPNAITPGTRPAVRRSGLIGKAAATIVKPFVAALISGGKTTSMRKIDRAQHAERVAYAEKLQSNNQPLPTWLKEDLARKSAK